MRLGAKLLGTSVSLNSFSYKDFVTIYQGENLDIYFQLIDQDQELRYIPDSGATVLVDISRFSESFGTISNLREVKDYSISRQASEAFVGDRSVWKLTLTTTDTETMMSSDIRFTLTEGNNIKKTLIEQAIVIIRGGS